jgi:hypothetical protein
MSSNREPSPHRSRSPTDSPCQRRQKKEEDAHLLVITFKQVISQVKLINNNNNRLATYAKHAW